MTHMRYWAMTFAVAIGGAFLAIERFAFAPSNAVWIALALPSSAVACHSPPRWSRCSAITRRSLA